MKPFLNQLIKNHFPHQHIKYAVGYGSGVFKQANYGPQQKCVIDMLLFVDDSRQFHEANMAQNYKHYSYLSKRLPLDATNGVQQSGAGLYFNPLIPLSSFETTQDD